MIALFCNIRGMEKLSRIRLLKEIIGGEHVDIVGLQETIKQDFASNELQSLTPGVTFNWKWLPAKGHSGGILVCVKDDILQVEEWKEGEFFVEAVIRNRLSNFRWSFWWSMGLQTMTSL